jgi:hypothetical protein
MKTARTETSPEAALALPEPAEEGRRWRRVPLGPDTARRREESSAPSLPVEGRVEVEFPVTLTAIDPQRDLLTGQLYYETGEAICVRNASRRGIGLRCTRPLAVGTRLVLQLGFAGEPVELIARTCWSRVEYARGEHAGRPIAALGVELLEGSQDALERYERSLAQLIRRPSVAAREALG